MVIVEVEHLVLCPFVIQLDSASEMILSPYGYEVLMCVQASKTRFLVPLDRITFRFSAPSIVDSKRAMVYAVVSPTT